jgi:hypothetical protein
MLTRDQILAADDLKSEDVSVPEWGGSVRVRSMMATDRDAYEQNMLASRGADEKANLRNIRARLVAFCLIDEAGERLFSDTEIDALGRKNAAVLDRLFDVASRLNAIGDREVAELGKPSAPTPDGATPSDSPAS